METLEAVEQTCDIHKITYQAERVKLQNRIIEQQCPECIKIADDKEKQIERDEMQKHQDMLIAKKFERSGIPPRYTTRVFDNYRAETESQKQALQKARNYTKNITENMKTGAGLILTGKPGTGKTHLACAVANDFIDAGGKVLFITVSGMIRKIRETYRRDSQKTEQQAINEFRDMELLIIDEVGVQKGTESEENLLFEVINERYSYFRPTILISNETLVGIKKYIGERAMDRMVEGGGDFIEFTWDSYRLKVAKDENLANADQAKYMKHYSENDIYNEYPLLKGK